MRRAYWILGSLAGAVALGWTLWRTSDLGRAAADLDHQRALARREGVPMEYADLVRLETPVPFDDNAAEAYREAFDGMRAPLGKLKLRNLVGAVAEGAAKPEDLAALRAALARAAPALAEAREGAARRGFSFAREWDQGAALAFPEYADAQNLARALLLRAMLAPAPPGAVADLRAAARMRARFGAEPVFIAALTGDGMEGAFHTAIRAIGRRGPAWAAAVAPTLSDLGPIPPLRRSLALEAVWGNHLDDELAKHGFATMLGLDGQGAGPQPPFVVRLMGLRPVRDANMARVVRRWRDVWRRLPGDPTDFRAARAAFAPSPGAGPSYALRDLLTPELGSLGEANARCEADRRLTRAALALWSGGTPALERDPFGTGPLKLRRSGSRWTVYSVGPDGRDDGGRGRRGYHDERDDLAVRSGNEEAPP